MSDSEHDLEPRLLDARQAARLLGVSTASIRRWTHLKRLRTVKLGKSARYCRHDLEALIARGTLDDPASLRTRPAREAS
jgi:excisionase family DNA binding protein